jgi:hypothetical protein
MQNRLACGGTLLPQRYRRLVIKAQSSLRYEEFDFSYYNKTRFAGLENDLPNCYCNALLQVRAYGANVLIESSLRHNVAGCCNQAHDHSHGQLPRSATWHGGQSEFGRGHPYQRVLLQ